MTACGAAGPTPEQAAPAHPPPPAEVVVAPPPAAFPELPPAERELHVRDLSAEIDRAERVVEQATKPGPRPPTDPGKAPQAPAGAEAGCADACLALASMRRSGALLCRLTGDSDPRCGGARARIRAAEEKVERAACSCPRAG